MAGTLGDDGDDDLISGINVTPLVDVTLVVLIIFIVTASFLLKSAIPLDLPQAQTGQEAAASLLTVAIAADGGVYLNGERASVADIPAAVAETRARARAAGETKPLSAFVSADVAADYGRFAAVVDRLRLEGVYEIAMDTQPVPLDPPTPTTPGATP